MKTVNRILLVAALVMVLLIVMKVKSCSWFGDGGSTNTIEIQKSTVDMGRLISGNKISIRDNIIVKQQGNLKVDGNYLGFGNENKEITLSFFAEIGYRPSDIIRSERIDSIKDGEIVSKTLVLELPLPDTLLFLTKNAREKSNEWFWEGWYKDEVNRSARLEFLSKLYKESYSQLRKKHITNDPNNTAMEATKTLYNYVNNAYRIGKEKGFDSIFATFSYTENGEKHTINVFYNGTTLTTPETKIEPNS